MMALPVRGDSRDAVSLISLVNGGNQASRAGLFIGHAPNIITFYKDKQDMSLCDIPQMRYF
jgi:hypothetical protein